MASTNEVSGLTENIFESLKNQDFYIGTSNPSDTERSPQMGLADVMIFDGSLKYWELMNIYYGYNQVEYQAGNVVQN